MLRDDHLSLASSRSRAGATVAIQSSRQHGFAMRPHSSLACLTPLGFRQHHQVSRNRTIFGG
jgi:hypothetical protein